MFGKLFGTTAPKQENKANPAQAQETINKMQAQIENIEMRIKKLDNDQQMYKKQALEKNKAGDKRAAVIALRKSKMFEKELAKLEGQQMMMEQQMGMITGAQFDQMTMGAMQDGKVMMEALQQKVDHDQIMDLQDDIAEQLDKHNEVADTFAQVAQDGKDELEDELNEMMALEEMDAMAAPDTAVIAPVPGQAQPA